MALVRYRLDPAASRVVVKARSSVHDTEAVWTAMSGTIEADPAAPGDGASADISVDMTQFDAGDWLKNRKLKKDLDVSRHPTAKFRLTSLENVEAGGETRATAKGTIDWRGRQAEISAVGTAQLSSSSITAKATFELDVRDLGVQPPKILMLKVEEIVSISVELRAAAE